MDHDYLKHYTPDEGDTLLVLGATDGDFLVRYKELILQKNLTIICVEPAIKPLLHLCLTVISEQLTNNVVILSAATSNETGISRFENTSRYSLSSLQGLSTLANEQGVKVESISKVITFCLDDLLQVFPQIDFICCDIEGAELETFYSSALLGALGPRLAIAAYHLRGNEETHKTLIPYLRKLGYNRVSLEASEQKPTERVIYASYESD